MAFRWYCGCACCTTQSPSGELRKHSNVLQLAGEIVKLKAAAARSYLFMATYRMFGAVFPDGALVAERLTTGACPVGCNAALDAGGTTNAAALLQASAARKARLLVIDCMCEVRPLPLGGCREPPPNP